MSVPAIRFQYEGQSHEIELFPEHAPQTIGLLIASLPARVDLHCAKIAGQHIFWHAPFLADYELARDIHTLPPGTFLYWPERQFLELIYGTLQAEKAQVSVLGRLTGDIDWLRALGENLTRRHGQEIFWASMTVEKTARHLGAPVQDSGGADLRMLRDEREKVWRDEPPCVRRLLERKGVMLPYGPLAMAEGEFRKLHELLWRLRGEGQGAAPAAIACAAFLVEAFIERIDGFCGLHESGKVLAEGARLLRTPTASRKAVVDELILYCGRMAAWLDLYIPWNDLNGQVCSALTRQGVRSS